MAAMIVLPLSFIVDTVTTVVIAPGPAIKGVARGMIGPIAMLA